MKNAKSGAKSYKFKKELNGLKDKLLTCDTFSEIQEMFFDVVAENQEFIRLSKKTKHPIIKAAVSAIGKQLLEKEVEITHLMLLKYKKANFYHGTCFIDGHMTSVFFFQDIDIGLISLSKNPPYTSYMRFTSIPFEEDGPLPLTTGRSKAIH